MAQNLAPIFNRDLIIHIGQIALHNIAYRIQTCIDYIHYY